MKRISKIIIVELIGLFVIFAYGAVYLTNSTPSNTTGQTSTSSNFPTEMMYNGCKQLIAMQTCLFSSQIK